MKNNKIKKKTKKKTAKTKRAKPRQTSGYVLRPVDYRILELVLEFPKITDTAIGEVVKLCRQNVNKIRHKEAFIKEFNNRTDKAINIIIKNKTKAVNKIVKHIESDDDRVSLKASELIAGDLLDPKKVILEIRDKEKARKEIESIFE